MIHTDEMQWCSFTESSRIAPVTFERLASVPVHHELGG